MCAVRCSQPRPHANSGPAAAARLLPLAAPLPQRGLARAQQAVRSHAGQRRQARGERQAPHGRQRAAVVLPGRLAEARQQDADDGRVHQVSPALPRREASAYLAPDRIVTPDRPSRDRLTVHHARLAVTAPVGGRRLAAGARGRARRGRGRRPGPARARLHGKGADDQLAAPRARALVRLGALGGRGGRQRVLAADAVTVDELPGGRGNPAESARAAALRWPPILLNCKAAKAQPVYAHQLHTPVQPAAQPGMRNLSIVRVETRGVCEHEWVHQVDSRHQCA